MDNKFKIPEMNDFQQLKVFADATSAFAEQLVILNKSIESITKEQNKVFEGMAKDQKDMKEYFMNANGFQKDLKNMQEDIIENVLTKINNDTIIIKEKIDSAADNVTKAVYTKILKLVLSATGLIGGAFYVIQNIFLKHSINEIIEQVIKQLPK